MTCPPEREGLGASSPSAPTGLSSLRDGAPSGLHPDGLQSAGAEIAEWQRRDEAYGRMIEALQAGDDRAYRAAMRDFWQI